MITYFRSFRRKSLIVFITSLVSFSNLEAQDIHLDKFIELTDNKESFEKTMMVNGNFLVDHLEIKTYRYRLEGLDEIIHISTNEEPFTKINPSNRTATKDGNVVKIKQYSIGLAYNSSFAENYNKDTRGATTWYRRAETSTKAIIGQKIGPANGREEVSLTIQFSEKERYLKLAKEINGLCIYKGVEEVYGEHFQVYQYNKFTIKCCQMEDIQVVIIEKKL
jgi:hypothetical protein